jgi:hypothetical protein
MNSQTKGDFKPMCKTHNLKKFSELKTYSLIAPTIPKKFTITIIKKGHIHSKMTFFNKILRNLTNKLNKYAKSELEKKLYT